MLIKVQRENYQPPVHHRANHGMAGEMTRWKKMYGIDIAMMWTTHCHYYVGHLGDCGGFLFAIRGSRFARVRISCRAMAILGQCVLIIIGTIGASVFLSSKLLSILLQGCLKSQSRPSSAPFCRYIRGGIRPAKWTLMTNLAGGGDRRRACCVWRYKHWRLSLVHVFAGTFLTISLSRNTYRFR
jgi:hypothetical protein